MQCVAYAIQVTNKTDKKVIPHKKKKNLTPYKERVSLGNKQSIITIVNVYGSPRIAQLSADLSKVFPSKNVFDVRDSPN